MAIEIQAIGADRLGEYALAPMVCHVESELEIEGIDSGMGGFVFRERAAPAPYVKDYDAIDGGPLTWAKRFDLRSWGIWVARDGAEIVGGAAVGWNLAGELVGGRVAELWDIRVRRTHQRRGIGASLFGTAREWAKGEGCRLMKVETQNVNVAACRFYSKMGCEVGAVDRCAYWGRAGIGDEVMLTWYLELNP
jgi:GNAT superfamily N-acetyltransferase